MFTTLAAKALLTLVPWLLVGKVESPRFDQPVAGVDRANPPVARPVPGKPGFCFSPFTGRIVDVRDIPPGTLVADPTVEEFGDGLFRVPPEPGGE